MKRQGNPLHHLFHKLHHPGIIMICNIQFHLGEFRIVKAVHSLIPEIFRKFIYPFISPHNQAFQVQFIGDPQIKGLIKGIVMGLERPGSCATIKGLQHGCFNLEIIFFIQEISHGIDEHCPLNESLSHRRIYDKVNIPLPVTMFRIRESIKGVAFFLLYNRERSERLAKNPETLDIDRDFAHLRPENMTMNADDITNIEEFFK